ncbi:hypothetical protein [Sneathiella sp.]|jgi:hypothetical protein|uniref:hypothetical protein n=1 Tax=Sneathiella sp. TaxID=1964365 RepID=UPI0039E3CC45
MLAHSISDYDLAALDFSKQAETAARMQLKHPVTGEALPTCIWLQGIDAPAYRETLRRQIDEQIEQGREELKALDLENRHLQRLAALTVKWEQVTYHGKDIVFSTANAEKLYREQVWIREQVTRFVEDRSRFI